MVDFSDPFIIASALVAALIFIIITGYRYWPRGKVVREHTHSNAGIFIPHLGNTEVLHTRIRRLGNVTPEMISRLKMMNLTELQMEGMRKLLNVPLQEWQVKTAAGNAIIYNIDVIPTNPKALDDGFAVVEPMARADLHELIGSLKMLNRGIQTRRQEADMLMTDHFSFMTKVTSNVKGWKRDIGGMFPIPMKQTGATQYGTGIMPMEGVESAGG